MRIPAARAVVAVTTALIALAACGSGGDPAVERPDGEWVLVEGEGPGGQVPIVDTQPVTLRIDDDELSGTAACNGYGGTAVIDGRQLRLQEVFQTEMACEGEDVMASEAAYMEALREVSEHHRSGDELELRGPDVHLRFESLPSDGDAAAIAMPRRSPCT